MDPLTLSVTAAEAVDNKYVKLVVRCRKGERGGDSWGWHTLPFPLHLTPSADAG